MTTKITREVIASHLHCKLKGWLKQAGESATRSDYEAMLLAAQEEVRLQATGAILARHGGDEVARGIPLTAAALKAGPLFVLDATSQDDRVSLQLDGLKRVDGPSKLGDFHYVPMLFHEGEKVRKEQRLLLEVYALLLSRVQGRPPSYGVVWHGKECRAAKLRLSPDPRKAERVLQDLQQGPGSAPPQLVLNDHCPTCEFRQRCHAQAVQKDNLSLLRGVGEKEVKAYARKGILTLTQLAHTFRPRRKGKRATRKTPHRYHALQALAIRDKRVYGFGTPELRDSPVRVYLDMEGKPDEGFVYLIGLIVVRDGAEERFSFWADDKSQEQAIFEKLMAVLARYEDFVVFCYGGYERAFLKRMRQTAKGEGTVDRVLDALVNVLSLVYAHVYFPTYSNGLKEVGSCLGCRWSEPDASGLQSIVWRMRWEATGSEDWKEKLTRYNLEDCASLKQVTGFLRRIGELDGHEALASVGSENGIPISHAEDHEGRQGRPNWHRSAAAVPDFDHIKKCAYFDYQRDKVYLRTSKAIRKVCARRAKARATKLRPNQVIEMREESCPRCGGPDIRRLKGSAKVKVAYDLLGYSRRNRCKKAGGPTKAEEQSTAELL